MSTKLSLLNVTVYSRLILIAEKTTVYDEFPTPLINRLEKHFVLYSSVLEDWQTETLAELEMWIKDFSHISNSQSRYVHVHVHLSIISALFSSHHKIRVSRLYVEIARNSH